MFRYITKMLKSNIEAKNYKKYDISEIRPSILFTVIYPVLRILFIIILT